MYAIDVSNSSSPTIVDSLNFSGDRISNFGSVTVEKDLLYFTTFNSFVNVVSIGNPTDLKLICSYDMGYSNIITKSLSTDKYWYIPENMNGGIDKLRIRQKTELNTFFDKNVIFQDSFESLENTSLNNTGPSLYDGKLLLFVDPNHKGANNDNNKNTPFQTIQGALDTIGKPTNLQEEKERYMILIASNNYDEDLTIPSARHIILCGLGPWTLGDGSGSFYSSSTPRNITWAPDQADEFGGNPRPTLVINTITDGLTSSTHSAYAVGVRISGNIIINAVGTSHELHLNNVDLIDQLDTTGSTGTPDLDMYLYHCQIDGILNSPDGNIVLANDVEFSSSVTCNSYGRLTECEIKNGMTISTNVNAVPPKGIFNCTFNGTFTGPANSLVLDTVTNYYFNSNSSSLGGSASKTLLFDTTI